MNIFHEKISTPKVDAKYYFHVTSISIRKFTLLLQLCNKFNTRGPLGCLDRGVDGRFFLEKIPNWNLLEEKIRDWDDECHE